MAPDRPFAARIRLTGEVGHAAFPPWIARHARRLGVRVLSLEGGPGEVILGAEGPEEMVRALALGCSLGPREVRVAGVEVSEAAL